MDHLLYINEIFFALVESIIILALYFKFSGTQLHNKKVELWKIILFPIFYTVVSFWASTYFPMGIHTIIILAFIILTLAILTSTTILGSFIIVAIISILLITTEFITQSVMNIVVGVDFTTTMNTDWYKFIYSCIAKALQVFVVFLAYKSKLFNNRLRFVFKKENTIGSFLILQMFFMGVFIFSLNYGIGVMEHLFLYNILLSLIFILSLCVSYYLLHEMKHLIDIRNKFQVQDEYLKNMETILNIIRKEKHDFSNHLNTLYAMCALNRPDTVSRIKKYISSLDTNLKSSYHFYNTGNEYVDGLLAVKSNEAYVNDIHLEVNFEAPLTKIDVVDHDLISMLSNIIDNAFGCFPEKQEKKIVSIVSYIENGKYHISISNNGPMIQPEIIGKIFDKGFSTKTHSRQDHGFGLYITKQLVHQNGGEIDVKSTKYETEFIISFSLKDISFESNRQIASTSVTRSTN